MKTSLVLAFLLAVGGNPSWAQIETGRKSPGTEPVRLEPAAVALREGSRVTITGTVQRGAGTGATPAAGGRAGDQAVSPLATNLNSSRSNIYRSIGTPRGTLSLETEVVQASEGDPVTGVDVQLEQMPGGIRAQTKIKQEGRWSFEAMELAAGDYVVRWTIDGVVYLQPITVVVVRGWDPR